MSERDRIRNVNSGDMSHSSQTTNIIHVNHANVVGNY